MSHRVSCLSTAVSVSTSMRKTEADRQEGMERERERENFHRYLSVISTGLLFCRRRGTGNLTSSTISIPADLRLRHDSDTDLLHVCVTDMSCRAIRCGSTSCVRAFVAEILLSTMMLSSLVP